MKDFNEIQNRRNGAIRRFFANADEFEILKESTTHFSTARVKVDGTVYTISFSCATHPFHEITHVKVCDNF